MGVVKAGHDGLLSVHLARPALFYVPIAQRLEHHSDTVGVSGSNPDGYTDGRVTL